MTIIYIITKNKGMTWKLIDGKRVWFEKVG